MTAIIDHPPTKFAHTRVTADGSARAHVAFTGFGTLWFNTGTLCNLACHNCYIESSPRNDALVYLSRAEVAAYLDEASGLASRPGEIGFTGGEPFMNPDMIGMCEDALAAGFRVLILTNAMKPMHHVKAALLDLHARYPQMISLRISLDGYTSQTHEELRGPRSWEPALAGLVWACEHAFDVAVAGRTIWGEDEASTRTGFAKLFAALGLALDAADPARLVLFPEMDSGRDVPEITEQCWDILGKSPASIMCASSRMVVKPKGAARPHVASCTLLPYAPDFAMGDTLTASMRDVSLNHPYCAQFCVLGGASCSAGA